MHLFGLTPSEFGLSLAISVAVVATLYRLKQRRRTVVVSFAPLWEKATADHRRTSLFERLRRVLSFLAQTAFVLLVLLAIARPRISADAERERRFAIVLDAGASMQAALPKKGSVSTRTRFDEAKSLARALVLGLGEGDRAIVVRAGTRPDPAGAFETDRRELLARIDALHPDDAASDLDEAVRFAGRLVAGRADRVVVLTDRPRGASFAGVAWRRVGTPLDNLAIVKFAARGLSESPGEYELFYEVRNFGRAEVRARLRIERVGRRGATLDDRPLTLGPGGAASDVLHGLAAEDETLRARLVDEKGGPLSDGLALDDAAEASARAPRVVKVLVVGAPDFFLDSALRSDPFVTASRAAAADYRGPGDADVVIFDGCAPAPAPPRAIYVKAEGAASPVKIAGEITDAFIDRADASHPVMRWVGDLADVGLARSRSLVAEPGDAVLASCAGAPVMLAREHAGARLVAIGFALRESDLPLRVAFPKIVRNAVRWTATGEIPDASAVTGRAPGESVSNLWAVSAPPETAPPEPPPGESVGLELAPALAAAALALTLLEWLSYHRRWTV